jgi:hypothetical protein
MLRIITNQHSAKSAFSKHVLLSKNAKLLFSIPAGLAVADNNSSENWDFLQSCMNELKMIEQIPPRLGMLAYARYA